MGRDKRRGERQGRKERRGKTVKRRRWKGKGGRREGRLGRRRENRTHLGFHGGASSDSRDLELALSLLGEGRPALPLKEAIRVRPQPLLSRGRAGAPCEGLSLAAPGRRSSCIWFATRWPAHLDTGLISQLFFFFFFLNLPDKAVLPLRKRPSAINFC